MGWFLCFEGFEENALGVWSGGEVAAVSSEDEGAGEEFFFEALVDELLGREDEATAGFFEF